MKGGKRSPRTRALGPKCHNETDFLTQDLIDPVFAIRLGKSCFDIRSIINYVRQGFKFNPLTRELFTEADYVKITLKKLKLRHEFGDFMKDNTKTPCVLYSGYVPPGFQNSRTFSPQAYVEISRVLNLGDTLDEAISGMGGYYLYDCRLSKMEIFSEEDIKGPLNRFVIAGYYIPYSENGTVVNQRFPLFVRNI